MKKLNETINDILTDNGIFHYLHTIDSDIEWLDNGNDKTLDIEYYLNHSGDKYISPMYNKLLESDPTNHMTRLANIILLKYKDNWQKLYTAYFDSDYNPIENYAMTETETPNLTTTEAPNLTHSTTDTQETNLTTSQSSDASTYGFNSDESTPTDEGSSSQTITGDADENVRTSTTSETGTKTTSQTGSKTLIRSGNIGVTTSQQMLNSEIQLRKFDFYNMIMNDIDNVLCLNLY